MSIRHSLICQAALGAVAAALALPAPAAAAEAEGAAAEIAKAESAGAEVAEAEYAGEIIVNGSILEAQEASVDAKRKALNVSDVASADAVGRFPDQNSAAALSRLPAVAVQRDQGQEIPIPIRRRPRAILMRRLPRLRHPFRPRPPRRWTTSRPSRWRGRTTRLSTRMT